MSLLNDIQANGSLEYLSYTQSNPSEQVVGDFIQLYGQDYILERNETYELANYMPGWFTIGDDSGGVAILMQLDGSSGVYRCGHGAIGSCEPEVVAESFTEWLTAGCPTPWMEDEDEDDEDA